MQLRLKFLCGIFLFSFAWAPVAMQAQQANYTMHVIKKGETLSALAKQYGVKTADIMQLNGMNDKSILRIDQKIKIPSLSPQNNSIPDTKKNVAAATVAPSGNMHTVQKKETLYSIGKQYNVSVEQLKAWNRLANDNIREGQKLVIATNEKKTVPVTTPPSKTEPAPKPAPPPVQKDLVKHSDPVQQKPVEEKKLVPLKPEIVKPAEKKEVIAPASTPSGQNEGYFASFYAKGDQQLNGEAGVFKTNSGWADGKYYVLINNVKPDMIVRITAHNRTIYAKVMGPLPNGKGDAGLLMRMSNAAASGLGIADERFGVTVNY